MQSSGKKTAPPKTNQINQGKWSKTENDRFMKGLELYGRNWIKVQKKVKSRSVIQVRSHAQKMFQNMSKKDIDALVRGSDYTFDSEYDRIGDQKKGKKLKLPKGNESERRNKNFSEGETDQKVSNSCQNGQKEDQFSSNQDNLPEIKTSFFSYDYSKNMAYFQNGGNFMLLTPSFQGYPCNGFNVNGNPYTM